MVEVHEQKYDAAQDLHLYMNSNGSHVQVGLFCTIKGNYCAMIEDPLSYEWKTRASIDNAESMTFQGNPEQRLNVESWFSNRPCVRDGPQDDLGVRAQQGRNWQQNAFKKHRRKKLG